MSILSRRDGPRADSAPLIEECEDWRVGAACLAKDPELFFPLGTGSEAVAQTVEAKSVCRDCRARQACLEWALGRDGRGRVRGEFGVWGGLSETERRTERRRRSRRAVRPEAAA